MGWNTYANRGSALEELVIMASGQYRGRKIARVDKIATPSNVHGGYYKEKSTVDFVGVLSGGKTVAFDCKETKQKSLPLKNIYGHQMEYMQDVVDLGGYAFLIVSFKSFDEYYRLDFETLIAYWNAWVKGNGRASIPYKAFNEKVKQEDKVILHYLKGLV